MKGAVMPIGGAEERSSAGAILQRFMHLAGGTDADVLILPTASEDADAGQEYAQIFNHMGAKSVEIAPIHSREIANDPKAIDRLNSATAVFITGGDQRRLSTLVVGTLFASRLRERNQREGLVVAGTSAGASVLGAYMMESGEEDAPPHKGMVEVVAGFGLVLDVIIDQHFNRRGRIGRLLATFAANPGLVAFGIDENTAAIISADGMATVVGVQSVLVIDGRQTYSDFGDRTNGDILTITGSTLHCLAPGRIFDLNRRTVLHLVQEQTSVITPGNAYANPSG